MRLSSLAAAIKKSCPDVITVDVSVQPIPEERPTEQSLDNLGGIQDIGEPPRAVLFNPQDQVSLTGWYAKSLYCPSIHWLL